ncbi:CRISPR-associated protein Cas4 [Nitrosopumilus adriaticus]|uniref:Uncharacterized protein n=1 Tax=Nitrosopumilus adriaticus TaxID=1580092 RepID=A0A0D5C3Y7_9ARCH|nr:CRISPR-associated protein Cas4 [Nitrosopumilus adriaticus]AJW71060.1 hypothetical protein NADRNF5_1374 [Nitrosopumilus adriaticus]
MSSVLQINQFESKFQSCRNHINGEGGEKISEQYRGYVWNDVTPEPHLSIGLPFGPVGYNYCDSGRYIYLKKVKNLPDSSPDNANRIRGRILHDSVMDFLIFQEDISKILK